MKNGLETKLVVLVGAGYTRSEAEYVLSTDPPPLDRTFFDEIKKNYLVPIKKKKYPMVSSEYVTVVDYIKKYYEMDILKDPANSLENIITTIYTDIFQKPGAFEAFRNLIKIFNRHLAVTTNKLKPNSQSLLYRILEKYLSEYSPEQISIITFNQDIQIEKTLSELSHTNTDKKEAIFNFPSCYAIDYQKLTKPKSKKKKKFDRFEIGENSSKECINVLKLHGSLNWYSRHKKEVSKKTLFRPTSSIYITRRRRIAPDMTYEKEYTFPVIVPPIIHKSGIFHNNFKSLWNRAETCFKNAEEILIYGYSCPSNDLESTNLLKRAFRKNNDIKLFSIIDPDSSVVKKYIEITGIHSVHWYNSAEKYLKEKKISK